MGSHTYAILAAVTVLILILIFANEKKWLNPYLPSKWDKQGFVGAYGRTPGMQGCIAYGGPGGRYPFFNRCTYV